MKVDMTLNKETKPLQAMEACLVKQLSLYEMELFMNKET